MDTIKSRIDKLVGKIQANEMMITQIENMIPKNIWFMKFLGTFTTVVLGGSIVFLISTIFFHTDVIITLLVFLSITFLLSIFFSNSSDFYIFGFIKDSLGLNFYQGLLTDINKHKSEIEKDTTTLEILQDILSQLWSETIKL